MRGHGRLMVVLSLVVGFAVFAAPASAAEAEVELAVDCASSVIMITSSRNISNVVYSVDGDHSRVEFGDEGPFSYSLALDGVITVWVKSGNNNSADGPGYGERFDIPSDACAPVDADGDGYPADVDCDDDDPNINLGAVDIPNNGIDENCDGSDLVVGEGDLRFTLTWDTDDDLDLYVTDPFGERITFVNTTSASGGELDRDDNVGVCGADPEPGGVENIYWDTVTLGGGDTYVVELSSYNDCDQAVTANYTIQVFVSGSLVQTVTGTTNSSGSGTNNIVDSFSWVAP